MPRKPRQLCESQTYHVMVRGNEKKEIFYEDNDRIKFLDIIEKTKSTTRFNLYAYCLMDNHVHLTIQEKNEDVSQIMKRINVSYAYYFNKKYQRVGHVFQDRFKSEPIENEAALLAVIRYIHNNPVKAKIVALAEDYPWSSYHEFETNGESRGIIDTATILKIFSSDNKAAIKLFKEFNNQNDNRDFLEHSNMGHGEDNRRMRNENEVEALISNFLTKNGITKDRLGKRENIQLRNQLIKKICAQSSFSIRELAELLGVNRGIVLRGKG